MAPFDVLKKLLGGIQVTLELLNVVLLGCTSFMKRPDSLRPRFYLTFYILVLLLGELHLVFLSFQLSQTVYELLVSLELSQSYVLFQLHLLFLPFYVVLNALEIIFGL